MAEKIIDKSFIKGNNLLHYLVDKNNKIVFCDYAAIESYKGRDPVMNLYESIKLASIFPNQVIILKPTSEIMKLSLHFGKRQFEDERSMREFNRFCKQSKEAFAGDKMRRQQILDKSKKALAWLDFIRSIHMSNLPKSVDAVRDSMSQKLLTSLRTWSLPTAELKEEFMHIAGNYICGCTMTIFLEAPFIDMCEIPTDINKASHTLTFRLATTMFARTIEYIRKGAIVKNFTPDKLLNESVDLMYITYATYYDGLLSKDASLKHTYNIVDYILKGG